MYKQYTLRVDSTVYTLPIFLIRTQHIEINFAKQLYKTVSL